MITLTPLIAGFFLLIFAALLRLVIRRGKPLAPPVCRACAYSIQGLKGEACPECGANLEDFGVQVYRFRRSGILTVLCMLALIPAVLLLNMFVAFVFFATHSGEDTVSLGVWPEVDVTDGDKKNLNVTIKRNWHMWAPAWQSQEKMDALINQHPVKISYRADKIPKAPTMTLTYAQVQAQDLEDRLKSWLIQVGIDEKQIRETDLALFQKAIRQEPFKVNAVDSSVSIFAYDISGGHYMSGAHPVALIGALLLIFLQLFLAMIYLNRPRDHLEAISFRPISEVRADAHSA